MTLLGNVSDRHGPLVVAKLYVILKAVADKSGDVHGNIETIDRHSSVFYQHS